MDKENRKEIEIYLKTIKWQSERLKEAISDLKLSMKIMEDAFGFFETTVLERLDDFEAMVSDDD